MKFSLEKWLCKVTGRRFHFAAEIVYMPDPHRGIEYISRHVNFSMDARDSTRMDRDIRKLYGSSIVSSAPKYMLKNGHIEIRNLSYLGWYK